MMLTKAECERIRAYAQDAGYLGMEKELLATIEELRRHLEWALDAIIKCDGILEEDVDEWMYTYAAARKALE